MSAGGRKLVQLLCPYQCESTKEVDIVQLLPFFDRRVGDRLEGLKCAMIDDNSVDLASKLHSKVCDFRSVLSLLI